MWLVRILFALLTAAAPALAVTILLCSVRLRGKGQKNNSAASTSGAGRSPSRSQSTSVNNAAHSPLPPSKGTRHKKGTQPQGMAAGAAPPASPPPAPTQPNRRARNAAANTQGQAAPPSQPTTTNRGMNGLFARMAHTTPNSAVNSGGSASSSSSLSTMSQTGSPTTASPPRKKRQILQRQVITMSPVQSSPDRTSSSSSYSTLRTMNGIDPFASAAVATRRMQERANKEDATFFAMIKAALPGLPSAALDFRSRVAQWIYHKRPDLPNLAATVMKGNDGIPRVKGVSLIYTTLKREDAVEIRRLVDDVVLDGTSLYNKGLTHYVETHMTSLSSAIDAVRDGVRIRSGEVYYPSYPVRGSLHYIKSIGTVVRIYNIPTGVVELLLQVFSSLGQPSCSVLDGNSIRLECSSVDLANAIGSSVHGWHACGGIIYCEEFE